MPGRTACSRAKAASAATTSLAGVLKGSPLTKSGRLIHAAYARRNIDQKLDVLPRPRLPEIEFADISAPRSGFIKGCTSLCQLRSEGRAASSCSYQSQEAQPVERFPM
jgi:hypothetical protein